MSVALKHRWSLANNFLSGLTARRWFQLLRENRFDIDLAYMHRAAFITALSLVNSAGSAMEKLIYGRAIARVEISRAPLFILGHWRSGTTHLHNLLALDRNRFAYANTYQAVSPFTFLTTESFNSRCFGWLLAETRPMDNMAQAFSSPQEDELALCLISGMSPYLGLTFPRRQDYYERYLTFEGVSPDQVKRWKEALIWYVKKLTYKYKRPLILKSPSHTARIKMLLEVFPDARFIHIHRNPYEVFQSTRHYFGTAAWYAYLQKPDRAKVDQGILDRYAQLYQAFFKQRRLIPQQRYCEVAFEDLEANPIDQMRRIYDTLGLDNFQSVKPELQAYLGSLSDYRKNEYKPLDDVDKQRVAQAWGQSFEHWGYSI